MTGVDSSTRWTSVSATEGKLNMANRKAKAVAYINFDFFEIVAISIIIKEAGKKKYRNRDIQ